jgi:xanthine dehydrogenase accessory factor
MRPRVLVLGAGDLASGVAHRLVVCRFPVAMTELPEPRAIRRSAAFAQAAFDGEAMVEGVRAVRVADERDAETRLAARDAIPLLLDPEARCASALRPDVAVDARLLKRSDGLLRGIAPFTIALGPGVEAGVDADAVVETQRGPNLGRVYRSGRAEADTGVPSSVDGFTEERVLRAPATGTFRSRVAIGANVRAGEIVGHVAQDEVRTAIAGRVRGLLHDGLAVRAGEKIGDIDPRQAPADPARISDKARAVAGGVLEAILSAVPDPGAR